MRFNSKLHKMKKYKKAIRNKLINQIVQINDKQYSQYFTKDELSANTHNPSAQPQDQLEDYQNDQDFNMSQYLQYLSEEQRELIKQYNPEIPAICFMTKKEKKKYFDEINNNFKKKIHKAPQRRSKNNKNLKFKEEFQIKYFREAQKVSLIKNGKQEYENYQKQIHFS